MFRVFLSLILFWSVAVVDANLARSSFPGPEVIETKESNDRSFVALNKVFEIESLDFAHHGRDHFLTLSTASPSEAPTEMPSAEPTAVPSEVPTTIPTIVPSVLPSAIPSAVPSAVPSAEPSRSPSRTPSRSPTAVPSTRSPSFRPSLAEGQTYSPSAAPSATPTFLIATVIQYSVTQTVDNINSTQFYANYAANKLAFEETVASSTVGITSSDVNVTGVTDVTTSRRILQASTVATACMIDYDIIIPASTVAGYSSPEAAYNATKTALLTSVLSGAFTATLQSVAVAAGLTTLSKANSSALTVSAATVLVTVNTASPSTAPTSSNSNGKDHLNRGDISAIVICSVFFVAVAVGSVYYLLLQRRVNNGSPILPFYALSDHADPSQQQDQQQQQEKQEQLASQYPEPQHIVQYEQQREVMILGADTPLYSNPAVQEQPQRVQEQLLPLAVSSQDEDMKQVIIQT